MPRKRLRDLDPYPQYLTEGRALRKGFLKKIADKYLTNDGPIKVPAGTVSAPAYSFSSAGDDDTGMYAENNLLKFAVAGTKKLELGTGMYVYVVINGPDGTAAVPAVAFNTSSGTGLYLKDPEGDNQIGFSNEGTLNAWIGRDGIWTDNQFWHAGGTAGSPAYSFEFDNNTGVYRVSADVLGLSAGGILQFQISATMVTSKQPMTIENMKTGATAGAAGAATDELWATSGHATLPDGVVMLG